MRERTGVYRVLVGNRKGKRLLAKLSRRLENNIKVGLQELGELHHASL